MRKAIAEVEVRLRDGKHRTSSMQVSLSSVDQRRRRLMTVQKRLAAPRFKGRREQGAAIRWPVADFPTTASAVQGRSKMNAAGPPHTKPAHQPAALILDRPWSFWIAAEKSGKLRRAKQRIGVCGQAERRGEGRMIIF